MPECITTADASSGIPWQSTYVEYNLQCLQGANQIKFLWLFVTASPKQGCGWVDVMQMLMVIFDILVSHRRMSKWHEKRIQSCLREQQAMHAAKLDVQQRIDSNAQASTSHGEPPSAASDHTGSHEPSSASRSADDNVSSTLKAVNEESHPLLQMQCVQHCSACCWYTGYLVQKE